MKIKLDIGCGQNKKTGFIGVDIDKNSRADVLASALHLPFKDSSAAEINCSHLVEHLSPGQAQQFFDEIYRVIEEGGKASVKVDRDWTEKRLIDKDPTHKHRYKVGEIKKKLGKFREKRVKNKIYFFGFKLRNKISIVMRK